jgi:lysophospholipase L1-like esterase
MNAASAAEGLMDCTDPRLAELKSYLIAEKVRPNYEEKLLAWEPENYDKKGRIIPKQKTAEDKKQKVRIFLCGDSTGKNEDKNPDGMWGWGSQAYTVFDEAKCTFINCAKAGRSTRTYLNENRWEEVYRTLRAGDYVLIQFGHNDIGGIDKDKERGVIACAKDTCHVYKSKNSGKFEVVYSFGWYLRKMIGDAKEKGAIPVILSFTPRNEWPGGKIERRNNDYIPQWDEAVAKECGVEFVDIHNITADYLDKKFSNKKGDSEKAKAKASAYFNHDHTHTSLLGARTNCQSLAKGLRDIQSPLVQYLK